MSDFAENDTMTADVKDKETLNTHTQFLSYGGRNIFILVNHVVLSNLISLFGLGANVVNILVFSRQGLKNSMNLSFFVLAITDLMGLLTQLWHNFCLNPYVSLIDAPVSFTEIQFLTAGSPNACLVRITGWITVYITGERCLSIALPLKIKQIVTFERTAAILICIYLVNMASLAPLYFSAYFSWKIDPTHNATIMGVDFSSNIASILDLVFIFMVTLALMAFSCAIILTTILIISLKQKSKWRQASTYDKDNGDKGLSSKDKKTIRMVIVVASVLIVCYTPASINSILTPLVPGYSINGDQSNSFEAGWSFAFLLHSINSSVTMLLYYNMSSKYKSTFHQIFPMCICLSK
ncbi:growth hormone secretagogue receptor type 1 [Biomphalaria glabrata]|uniref:G-protein coupled receptors family 1 profile domain-containing protein n=1 Tax=Biomphalaria glabrata TaxID=6526 RepID=A0A2C9LEU8_BIOGL|nr:growth hormone secretagogue receptor type 1-like [Biomphalaria glabrata]KAI8793161.1 growth hormone secretagogue receptor type 1 [Biomphalaria glabrata]